MAFYPASDSDVPVAPAALRKVVQTIFAASGMSDHDSDILASSLVSSDIRGVHSHGVLRVRDYVGKLLDNGVDPRGKPQVASKKGGALVIDGGNAMGQISGTFAIDQTIEAAREHGIAFAAVRNSNHCGAMDWYAMRAAAANMIGICGTNALPTMAPIGGKDKVVGINPVGIALPGGEGGDFVLDFAFGATAHGKIRVYAQKGAPIPEGWALDKDGVPTTDAIEALTGLIQPIGAHKGVALAMAIGMLSTMLSGAGYGTQSGNMVDGAFPGRDGQFYLAIDISAFTPIAEFRQRVDDAIAQIHNSALSEGVERIFVPGEIERILTSKHQADGIPLPVETVTEIEQACARLKIPAPIFSSAEAQK